MLISTTLTYYLIAYLISTTLVSLHFLFNWKVRGQEGFDTTLGLRGLKANATQFVAFKNTKPFHAFYNLVVFPLAGVFMLHQLPMIPTPIVSLGIGTLWFLYSLILDLVIWIILPHPWRLTLHELFIAYQPWITFAYLAIFFSPFIASFY